MLAERIKKILSPYELLEATLVARYGRFEKLAMLYSEGSGDSKLEKRIWANDAFFGCSQMITGASGQVDALDSSAYRW